MKYNPVKHHRKSICLKGNDYCKTGAYFVNICVNHREMLLGNIIDDLMVLNKYGEMVELIIMHNHIHWIILINDFEWDHVGAGS
jgi:putative transposase